MAYQLGWSQQKELQIAATLPFRPGNVAVSNDRIFSTVHPLGNDGVNVQLIEITGKNSYIPFPDASYQSIKGAPKGKQIDSPLGIRIDAKNRLWIVDMGQNRGTTRVYAFDINTGKEVYQHEFSQEIAPKGSFIQDLAIDDINGFVFLADIANPGILVLDTNTNTANRITHASMQPENIDTYINGELLLFGGAPARVGINPITLSADKEILFYGAMSGTTWYAIPSSVLKEGKSKDEFDKALKIVGPKPVSDGVITDKNGVHYMTNSQNYGIDKLTTTGDLLPVIRDKRLDWPDNVAVNEGYLYIAVNQLHKTTAFTGEADAGTKPYYIYKLALK